MIYVDGKMFIFGFGLGEVEANILSHGMGISCTQ